MDITGIKGIAEYIFTGVTASAAAFLTVYHFYQKMKAPKKEKFVITQKVLMNHEFFIHLRSAMLAVSASFHFRSRVPEDQHLEDTLRDYVIILLMEFKDAMTLFCKKDIALFGTGQEWQAELSGSWAQGVVNAKNAASDRKINISFRDKWNAKMINHTRQMEAVMSSLAGCAVHTSNGERTCAFISYASSLIPIMASLAEGILRGDVEIQKEIIDSKYTRKVVYTND